MFRKLIAILSTVIIGVSVIAGKEECSFRKTLAFDRGWLCKFYNGDGKYHSSSKQIVIAFKAEAATLFCALPNSGVTDVEVQGELVNGEAELRCSFRDASGQERRSAWQLLKKGANQLTFKPGALPKPVKFTALSLRSASGTAEVRIGTVTLGGIAPRLSLLEINCDTPYPINIENPEENKAAALRLRYFGQSPMHAQFDLSLRNSTGQQDGKLSQALEFTPDSEIIVSLPPTTRNGIRYGEYTLTDKAVPAQKRQGDFTIARMIPAGPSAGRAEGFLFGVCSHPQRCPAAEQKREAAAAALFGAKVLREDAGWSRIQPRKDVWNFSSLDQTVEIFSRQGLELALIYSYTPQWAITENFKPLREKRRQIHNSRPDYEAWRAFIRRTAERYRGKIRFFEVWNEPDLLSFANFSTAEYIEMLEIASLQTRQAAPGAFVLTGGYTCMPPFHALNDQKHQEKTLRQAQAYYDIHAFHGHGVFSHYHPQIERLIEMRRHLGVNAPWWANETAVSSAQVGELEQAVTLWKKLFYSWAHGSIGYNWYDLRNDGNDPGNPEHNFGMLTRDFQPKAIYPAYNTIIRNFRNAEFFRETAIFKNINFFEFSHRDRRLAVFWSEAPGRNCLLAFRTDATKAELFDMFDNRKVCKISDGITLIPAGTFPHGVSLEPAGVLEPLGEMLAPAGRMRSEPGKGGCFQFTVRNPFPTSEKLRVKLTGLPPENIYLAGREKREISFYIPQGVELAELEVQADFLQREICGTISLPVAMLFNPDRELKRRPDFMLARKEQVTTLVPADPAKAHLFWQGVQDLSAAVSLAKANDLLKLRVEVIDDIHHQPYSDADIWKGDSIQFALQVPGQKKMWTFGLARSAAGNCMEWNWDTPAGFKRQRLQQAAVSRAGTKTVYEATLDLRMIGAEKAEELLFNLLANDNDGEMRESFIELAPGLGNLRRPDHYLIINLK